MTAEVRKRLILYSVAVVLLAGLAYGGFMYRAEPDVSTLVGSAEILAQTKAYDKAMENARRALSREPDNRYAHIIMGHCLGQVGQYDEAVTHYRRAVALSDPNEANTPSLRLYLGEMLIHAGKPEEAAQLAQEVLETDENQNARFVLAAAHIALERPDRAVAEYEKCVEVAPEDPEPLLLHALLLEKEDQLPDSLALLDQAARLAPQSPTVQLRRARVLAGMGEQEAAVETLLTVARAQAARMRQFLFAEDALESLRGDERLLAACRPPVDTE